MNGKGVGLGSLLEAQSYRHGRSETIYLLGRWVSEGKKASISAPPPSEPDMKGAERMYVAIRQYGFLTNEPVENVFQGVREGSSSLIIKNAPGLLAYYALNSGGGTLTLDQRLRPWSPHRKDRTSWLRIG